MKKIIFLVFLLSCVGVAAQPQRWYKGNTHTHTTRSDGDSSVEEVVDWYYKQGYNFLALTDHNKTFLPDSCRAFNLSANFILLSGNELTHYPHTTALGISVPMHTDSLVSKCANRDVVWGGMKDTIDYIRMVQQVQIDGINEQGGLPIVNHPNFFIGIGELELAKLQGVHHMEIYNAHPSCFNFGKPWHHAVEKKWDFILTLGHKLYGIGSDDTHYLKEKGRGFANPGRAWIMVKAENLNQQEIIQAIREGAFYASTGVEVAYYNVDSTKMSVKIDVAKTKANIRQSLGDYSVAQSGKQGCQIDIITANGIVVFSTTHSSMEYKTGNFDTYLRMRITYCTKVGNSYRTYYAWMQPIMR